MNKQIEEIKNCLCDVLEFDYSDESGVTKVDAKTTAEGLYNAGYRKASDVAREIFNDLTDMWHKGRGFISYADLVRLERLYEQKYTEDK